MFVCCMAVPCGVSKVMLYGFRGLCNTRSKVNPLTRWFRKRNNLPTGPGKTKTSLEVETQLWKQAQKAAIDRDRSIRAMIEEGLRLWIRYGETPADEIPVPAGAELAPLSPEELEVAAAAIALLREGHPLTVDLLDGMLRRYRGRVRITTHHHNHTKKRA